TGIEIKTTTPEVAGQVAEEIAGRLGPAYEVRSWEELNRALYGALKIEKLAAFIALCFILLVASFSIAANLLMMVTEKAREIAILKSMGARDGAIVRIFVAEGLYIGLVGLLIGVAVSVQKLTKVFTHSGRTIEVLRGLDFELRPGEMASVVGASGVGKSTLLHVLGTLDDATSGKILFDGVDVTRMNATRLAEFR